MQNIIVEKPYKFVPPHRGNWVPSLVHKLKISDKYLNYFEGVTSYEVRNVGRLIESLAAGHGIILAPNHCRYADPLAIGWVAREASTHVFAMASWHLFNEGRLKAFAMRMCGGFSVYREGPDRASLDTAIEAVSEAIRPLVIFPEGTVFRTNDYVQPLLDGVSFLARTAARKKEKAGKGRVVIHPVAIKYLFRGDVEQAVEPVVQKLERRLTWEEPAVQLDLLPRLERLSQALFSLREIQYFGAAQTGTLVERKQGLIERLLAPLEEQWLGKPQAGDLMPRVKQLRTKLLPVLTKANSQAERDQIWQHLADIYYAQMIQAYPLDYLDNPTDTRILETVERLEEDVHDLPTIQRPLHAVLEVGEAIEVDPVKPPRGEADPVTFSLQSSLSTMLSDLANEAKPFPAKG